MQNVRYHPIHDGQSLGDLCLCGRGAPCGAFQYDSDVFSERRSLVVCDRCKQIWDAQLPEILEQWNRRRDVLRKQAERRSRRTRPAVDEPPMPHTKPIFGEVLPSRSRRMRVDSS